jgi:hypothetical protein
MYTPLIIGCGGGNQFVSKIKRDFVTIHSAPSLSGELLLTKIHQQAEIWLLNFAQKNILMVPGNLQCWIANIGRWRSGRGITTSHLHHAT